MSSISELKSNYLFSKFKVSPYFGQFKMQIEGFSHFAGLLTGLLAGHFLCVCVRDQTQAETEINKTNKIN